MDFTFGRFKAFKQKTSRSGLALTSQSCWGSYLAEDSGIEADTNQGSSWLSKLGHHEDLLLRNVKRRDLPLRSNPYCIAELIIVTTT
jgi:hypothetical protein